MFFDKIVKIEKNYVERVENINIKVYTRYCVNNMQTDHFLEWFYNPFLVKFLWYMVTFGLVAYLETSAFKDLSAHSGVGGPFFAS